MIYRIECECGSTGTGEWHEKDMIDGWAAEHQTVCGRPFTTRMHPIHRAQCPTCSLTYYTDTAEQAEWELEDHFDRHPECQET